VATTILSILKPIFLAEDQIGRLMSFRETLPSQDPSITGISNVKPPRDPGYSIRPVERCRANRTATVWLDVTQRILTDHTIWRRVRPFWYPMPT
jgi:hypothetical protein